MRLEAIRTGIKPPHDVNVVVEVPIGETLTFTYGNLGGLSASFEKK